MAQDDSGSLEPSNELVRWLRLLALPLWARIILSALLVLVLLGGAALLGMALWLRELEHAASAVAMLAVALPVGLVVVALTFGQNSDKHLRTMTRRLLEIDVKEALEANCGRHLEAHVTVELEGCCANYVLRARLHSKGDHEMLKFRVEVNVLKANVFFWLPSLRLDDGTPVNLELETIEPYRHVILGAIAEGYALNEAPVHWGDAGPMAGPGLVFVRRLGTDFLLQPAQRLYFAQDLSFFARGILESQSRALRGIAK